MFPTGSFVARFPAATIPDRHRCRSAFARTWPVRCPAAALPAHRTAVLPYGHAMPPFPDQPGRWRCRLAGIYELYSPPGRAQSQARLEVTATGCLRLVLKWFPSAQARQPLLERIGDDLIWRCCFSTIEIATIMVVPAPQPGRRIGSAVIAAVCPCVSFAAHDANAAAMN